MNNSTTTYEHDDNFSFNFLNISGIVSLTISLVCCVYVMYHSFVHQTIHGYHKPFYQRRIGERLVIYMIWINIVFCLSNLVNVCNVYHIQDVPQPNTCAGIAFFVLASNLTYQMVHVFIALTALMTVTCQKGTKLNVKYDFIVLVTSLSIEFVPTTMLLGSKHLGAGIQW